jgi:hypothetical protein
VVIIEYLYKEDAKVLTERVKEYINASKQDEPEALTRKDVYMMKEDQQVRRIEYKAFNWIVTDYILESHLKFLAPFVRVFRSLDSENIGVITEVELSLPKAQFRELLNLLNPSNSLVFDVEDILIRVDPYGFDHITFSTSACILSEMIIDEQTQENLLENLE